MDISIMNPFDNPQASAAAVAIGLLFLGFMKLVADHLVDVEQKEISRRDRAMARICLAKIKEINQRA